MEPKIECDCNSQQVTEVTSGKEGFGGLEVLLLCLCMGIAGAAAGQAVRGVVVV